MQYGLKVLEKKLDRERSDLVEYAQYMESEDESTVRWATKNYGTCEHRIEELETTMAYVKTEVGRVKEEKRQAQMEASKKDNKQKQNSS